MGLPVPGGVPGAVSGGMPGHIPGGVPGAVSGGMPGHIPGVMPGAIHGGIPGAVPGVPGQVQGGMYLSSQSDISHDPLTMTSSTQQQQS